MATRGKILSEALETINGDRQDQYGDPENSFGLIAEYWTVYLRNKILSESEDRDINDYMFGEMLDVKDVAYMMTLFKIAREVHQHKRDNLVDAAGYLGIAGDMHNIPDHTCTQEEDEAFNELVRESSFKTFRSCWDNLK